MGGLSWVYRKLRYIRYIVIGGGGGGVQFVRYIRSNVVGAMYNIRRFVLGVYRYLRYIIGRQQEVITGSACVKQNGTDGQGSFFVLMLLHVHRNRQVY